MRTLLLLLLAATAAGGGPVVRKSGSAHELVLPAAMRQVLEAYDSSFKVWTEKDYAPLLLQEFEFTNAAAPFAVIGDFNGDAFEVVAWQKAAVMHFWRDRRFQTYTTAD